MRHVVLIADEMDEETARVLPSMATSDKIREVISLKKDVNEIKRSVDALRLSKREPVCLIVFGHLGPNTMGDREPHELATLLADVGLTQHLKQHDQLVLLGYQGVSGNDSYAMKLATELDKRGVSSLNIKFFNPSHFFYHDREEGRSSQWNETWLIHGPNDDMWRYNAIPSSGQHEATFKGLLQQASLFEKEFEKQKQAHQQLIAQAAQQTAKNGKPSQATQDKLNAAEANLKSLHTKVERLWTQIRGMQFNFELVATPKLKDMLEYMDTLEMTKGNMRVLHSQEVSADGVEVRASSDDVSPPTYGSSNGT